MMRRVSWLPSAPLRPGKTRGCGVLRALCLLRLLLALLALRLWREVHVQGEDVAVPHQLDAAARGDVGYEAPPVGPKTTRLPASTRRATEMRGRSTSASWKGMTHF